MAPDAPQKKAVMQNCPDCGQQHVPFCQCCCQCCHLPLTTHLRCHDCSILLGPGHEYQAIVAESGILLDQPCVDHRQRMSVPAYRAEVRSMVPRAKRRRRVKTVYA